MSRAGERLLNSISQALFLPVCLSLYGCLARIDCLLRRSLVQLEPLFSSLRALQQAVWTREQRGSLGHGGVGGDRDDHEEEDAQWNQIPLSTLISLPTEVSECDLVTVHNVRRWSDVCPRPRSASFVCCVVCYICVFVLVDH